MRKKLNKPDFEHLLEIGCDIKEAASFFDCAPQTIIKWCEKTYGMKPAEVRVRCFDRGNIALRRAQMDKAIKEKDTKMLIHLGEFRLGQVRQSTNKAIDENSAINILAHQIMEERKRREGAEDGNT